MDPNRQTSPSTSTASLLAIASSDPPQSDTTHMPAQAASWPSGGPDSPHAFSLPPAGQLSNLNSPHGFAPRTATQGFTERFRLRSVQYDRFNAGSQNGPDMRSQRSTHRDTWRGRTFREHGARPPSYRMPRW